MMKRITALLLCLLMLMPSALAEDAKQEERPLLEVHQMLIGYADGYYIRCGDVEIAIDGGKPVPFANNDDVPRILRELGADKLDAYIVTHWHLDHCENVNVILSEFGTEDTVVYSPAEKLPDVIKKNTKMLQVTPLANGVYRQMKMDDVITIGDLTITCVGPSSGGRAGTENPDSLNFVLQYGNRRMLFTGDYADSKAIVERFPELCSKVDVLKFPHHGSQPFYITSKAGQLVDPQYVLMPSTMSKHTIVKFFSTPEKKMEFSQVFNENDGHVVFLTDGGDYLEGLRDQNPADYAPKAQQ